jgi:putative hydrolase of the HAD superfamily
MSLRNKINVIAFDADDTLWHNEPIFYSAKDKFAQLLSRYYSEEWVARKLDEMEIRNLQRFGYGIKGFTLSMIETALELTEGRITGREIQHILGFTKEMLATPIELLDGVKETIETLFESHKLMVITKGDLFDQETKLARSGLGDYFSKFEIVSKKDRNTYQAVVSKYEINPKEFLMVGNSLKSDILPVLEIGAQAVHIPYKTNWFHEAVEEHELEDKNFTRLEKINLLPNWLNELERKA